MLLCSKLPSLEWRSADFLQVFLPKMIAGAAHSSTKISMVQTYVDIHVGIRHEAESKTV
jgi:hypothetical protein